MLQIRRHVANHFQWWLILVDTDIGFNKTGRFCLNPFSVFWEKTRLFRMAELNKNCKCCFPGESKWPFYPLALEVTWNLSKRSRNHPKKVTNWITWSLQIQVPTTQGDSLEKGRKTCLRSRVTKLCSIFLVLKKELSLHTPTWKT